MRGARLRPIVIAAGGTGGHFFPAEALARTLAARGERVVLMTDARSSAAHSPVFAGGEVHVIAGAGLAGRGFGRAAAGAAAIAKGTFAARRILNRLAPAAVVGFGGYPAVAPMLAARSLRPSPVLILHDQNAVLGKANRLLARLSDAIALSFAQTAGLPPGCRGTLTGNPVRPAILARAGAPYAPPTAGINLLVLGGSLGAAIFATLIPGALGLLPPALRARITLTMQCPAAGLERARAALEACGIAADLRPFFDNVGELLAASHLVVARAGGSTVAELAVVGRPAVLIPLTINADQRANANALAMAGGAVRLEQAEGAAKLAGLLQDLLNDPARLAAMAAAAAETGVGDATERLADLIQRAIAAAPHCRETTP